MARRDLTNAEIEAMGQENPGSAAEYLRLRQEELEAERQEANAKRDEEEWTERFIAAGGERSAAKAAYRDSRNENALIAAVLAEDRAVESERQRLGQVL